MAEIGAGEDIDLLVRHQLVGDADRIVRLAGIVAGDDLQHPATQHPALGVDFLDCQFPPLAVGNGEGLKAGIAVDLPDPHRIGGGCGQGDQSGSRQSHNGAENPFQMKHLQFPIPVALGRFAGNPRAAVYRRSYRRNPPHS
jgi:hypothetical protein